MQRLKKYLWSFCVVSSMVALMLALESKPVEGQQPSSPDPEACKANASIETACKKGVPIAIKSNVSQSASLQAVLIPATLAKRIFGKEVSQNYAVVEVIISNRDSKASLVVHSVFLDYSDWLLSGTSGQKSLTGLDATQAATIPSQVASIESRLVRGELLDSQQWTSRNLTMRALTFLGTAAVAFEFPFSTDVTKGIGAFNGTVVPGASVLWPDGTINQINRISDVGFQTNKIIPKQGSDILVAFFPIDRFLTPSFRRIFLSNPASLYVPGEMAADPKMTSQLEALLGPLVDSSHTNAQGDKKGEQNAFRSEILHAVVVPCSAGYDAAHANGLAENDADFQKKCQIQSLFNRISLNNIHLVIEGAMTVDVATVPATIYSVDFDGGNVPAIWTKTTEQTGTITGVYLTGGVPSVVGDDSKAIEGVSISAVADGSSDTQLNFKMTLSKCISPGTKVNFVVTKSASTDSNGSAKGSKQAGGGAVKQGASFPSMLYEFPQQPAAPCPEGAADQGAAGSTAGTPAAPATNKADTKTGQKPPKSPKS